MKKCTKIKQIQRKSLLIIFLFKIDAMRFLYFSIQLPVKFNAKNLAFDI